MERSIKLLIEHKCSQCGAPIVLQETERLITCEYCRVTSYLIAKNYFRYILPGSAPENEKLYYFPYWRFKGMLFSCAESGITHKFIDTSRQAIHSPIFPISVGLRSQALKLKFVLPETKGYFLKPALSFNNIINYFEQNLIKSHTDKLSYQSHIGETISLVYSPFYLNSKIYDAVLNQPLAARIPDDFLSDQPAEKPLDGHIQLIPSLCPDCGWDLQGEKDSLVLFCKHCNTAWKPSGKGFKKINYRFMPLEGDPIYYVPFYRVQADVSGVRLNSYADLVKLANIPKVVQDDWNNIGFYFWSPAFKIRPKTFINIARDITLSQPNKKLIHRVFNAAMHPVNLPVQEAVESLKMTAASFIRPKHKIMSLLNDMIIKPKKALLVYIGFQASPHSLIQPELHVAINKNQLALADNL